MRPDRLVLGECRGSEIRELLSALNTGHDGGAGTLHANSLADVPARLEALGALAGLTSEAMARQAVSAIGLVLHVERRGGSRHLSDVGSLTLDDRGRLQMAAVRAAPRPGERETAPGRGVEAGESAAGDSAHPGVDAGVGGLAGRAGPGGRHA